MLTAAVTVAAAAAAVTPVIAVDAHVATGNASYAAAAADGVVARQITYTVADVTSKVVYGILLAIIARKVSKHEGHDEAVASDVTMPRGGITDVAAPGRAA